MSGFYPNGSDAHNQQDEKIIPGINHYGFHLQHSFIFPFSISHGSQDTYPRFCVEWGRCSQNDAMIILDQLLPLSLEFKCSEGKTILNHAIDKNWTQCIGSVFLYGSIYNPNILHEPNRQGRRPLSQALSKSPQSNLIFSWLLDEGADPNELDGPAPEPKRYSPFHLAIKEGNIGAVNTLLESKRVEVNPTGDESYTPLMLAVETGSPIMAKRLIDEGADPTGEHKGRTPLMLAVDNRDLPMIELLLHEGRDYNYKELGIDVAIENAEGVRYKVDEALARLWKSLSEPVQA